MQKDGSHTKAETDVDLAERHCVPCEDGATKLTNEEISGFLWRVDDWECVKRHHLAREWTFDDFAQALAFVNRVGALAEQEGHHPDLFLKWGLVRAEIYTHSVDGLTESDFVLAAKIDQVPTR